MKLYNRIKETSVSTGINNITLAGSVQGFSRFNEFYSNGDKLFYCITNGVDYEIGKGTYNSNTLSRDTVLSSSNANNKINFSSEIKQVYVTYPGEKAVFIQDDTNSKEYIKIGDNILKSNNNVLEIKNSGDTGYSSLQATSGLFNTIRHTSLLSNAMPTIVGGGLSLSGNFYGEMSDLFRTSKYNIKTLYIQNSVPKQLHFEDFHLVCPTGVASNKFIISSQNVLSGSGQLNISPNASENGIDVKSGSNYRSIGVDKVLFGPNTSGTHQISVSSDTVRFTKTNGSGGHLKSRVYITDLILDIDNIPETNPYEAGVVWRDGDTLRISLG
jgi:hypothetical protein